METPNLSGLAAEASAENEAITVPLRNRSGEPYLTGSGQPVTISVLGIYSEPARKAQDATLRRWSKQRTAQWTPEMALANRISVAVAGLVGWNFEDAEHQPIPFTPENAQRVFLIAPWILEQVEQAMQGHADFFGANAKP